MYHHNFNNVNFNAATIIHLIVNLSAITETFTMLLFDKLSNNTSLHCVSKKRIFSYEPGGPNRPT